MFGVKKSKILQKLINSLLLIFLVLLLTKISLLERIFFQNTPLYDFDLYYLILQKIKSGMNPYTSVSTFSLGPPLVFLYYLPFSFIGLSQARILTTLVNIFAGFTSCFLLAKKFNRKHLATVFLILSIILFASFPARFSLGMGQPIMLISLLITLLIIGKQDFWKGFFLASAVLLKTIFIFPFLSFIKNNKKIVLVSLTVLVISTLFSLVFIKPNWHVYYLSNVFLKLNDSPSILSGLDYYNQSLKSMFFRFGLFNIYKIVYLPLVAIASLCTVITGSFELSVIFAILLSPISWQHYFLVLFPVFVKTFFDMEKTPKNLLIFTLSMTLWFVQFPWLHQSNVNFINALLASHFSLSGLLLSTFFIHPNKRN